MAITPVDRIIQDYGFENLFRMMTMFISGINAIEETTSFGEKLEIGEPIYLFVGVMLTKSGPISGLRMSHSLFNELLEALDRYRPRSN